MSPPGPNLPNWMYRCATALIVLVAVAGLVAAVFYVSLR